MVSTVLSGEMCDTVMKERKGKHWIRGIGLQVREEGIGTEDRDSASFCCGFLAIIHRLRMGCVVD